MVLAKIKQQFTSSFHTHYLIEGYEIGGIDFNGSVR